MAVVAEDRMMFVVRRLSIDYMHAGWLGRAFKVETRLQLLRGASMTLIREVINFKMATFLPDFSLT